MNDGIVFVVIMGSTLILTGSIMIILGRISYKSILKKERECTITTTAKIIDTHKLRHPVKNTSSLHTYHPVLEYTINGKIYKGTYTYGSFDENYYTLGSTVEICCNPTNKYIFYLKNDVQSKKRAQHIITAGIIIILLYY